MVRLEGVRATTEKIIPTPTEIETRLGAGSPSHLLDYASLAALYATNRKKPGVVLKRQLWTQLLRTALGEHFTGDDELFVEHTLLVATPRSAPTPSHGANIQAVTAPDGFPIYTSPVRPGREHAPPHAGGTPFAALRAHPGMLAELTAWHHGGRSVLVDLGHEGERPTKLLPVRGKRNAARAIDTKTYNALLTVLRAVAERGNAPLKTTFTALRHVTISPGRIGAMAAVALVILYLENHRTV